MTKKMLNTIRESVFNDLKVKPLMNEETHERDSFLRRCEILMEEAERKHLLKEEFEDERQNSVKNFIIRSNDPQFKNLRVSQEDALRKTIGDIQLKDDALIYHPDVDDITLKGLVNGLNIQFYFRYNDASGDGCYITCSDLQLTDANVQTIAKIRSAFQNWKQGLISDGNIMNDLEKAVEKK